MNEPKTAERERFNAACKRIGVSPEWAPEIYWELWKIATRETRERCAQIAESVFQEHFDKRRPHNAKCRVCPELRSVAERIRKDGA